MALKLILVALFTLNFFEFSVGISENDFYISLDGPPSTLPTGNDEYTHIQLPKEIKFYSGSYDGLYVRKRKK